MSHYFVIKARNVNAEIEDILSGFFFEHQAEGVSEELSFSQLDAEYSVNTIESNSKELNIYYTKPPGEDLILKAKSLFGGVDFSIEKQVDKDWLEEWKKGFKEFNLTKNINIVPSWLKPKNELAINIFIDPGMAFGTGTHETTQIAATLLSQVNLEGQNIADIGTGTGILAILSEKLNAKSVDATEIDEVAQDVARVNVQLNQCNCVLVRKDQIESLTKTYDIVIANIIDGVLLNIQKDLNRITSSGGYLILTGILLERESNFKENFNMDAFEVINRIEKNEWMGFLLKKK